MDQAPGLLALQDRGPGLALSPGAARCFGTIMNPTLFFFFYQPCFQTGFFVRFLVRIKFEQTVRTSTEPRKDASNRRQTAHSQPVLKKLVCDTSTQFHNRSVCGNHIIQACIMTEAS